MVHALADGDRERASKNGTTPTGSYCIKRLEQPKPDIGCTCCVGAAYANTRQVLHRASQGHDLDALPTSVTISSSCWKESAMRQYRYGLSMAVNFDACLELAKLVASGFI
jgi:hypothetical protein